MPSKDDDLSFEGAWKKQIEQEQEEPVEKKPEETKEVKIVEKPSSKEGDDFDVEW